MDSDAFAHLQGCKSAANAPSLVHDGIDENDVLIFAETTTDSTVLLLVSSLLS
jgi:hypothetical protein